MLHKGHDGASPSIVTRAVSRPEADEIPDLQIQHRACFRRSRNFVREFLDNTADLGDLLAR
jgi:hypothetical protein